MKTDLQSLQQITEKAIKILSKEMGIADTMRFLNQFSSGYGNYTEEREAMFKDLTLDDILQEMDQELNNENQQITHDVTIV
ncbi:conserved hypothetical protein [Rippkaea orientalis PCC 8801]|uniref:Uncharacterized protein n=1 Tax=Rippkaea orientalis (strain PCC 8801 / RF-1) TaxID=41431 RepID=B7K457_RIPO1|nr:hypothetical protein [Rippkaea orientalis]ACK67763.1 conserved hypothetical protein [Rippkaea orientalis PCC 8801]